MGLMCRQAGVPDDLLIGRRAVAALIPFDRNVILWPLIIPELEPFTRVEINGRWEEAFWVKQSYGINDNQETDDAHKEKALTDLLKAYGHELEFEG